MIDKKVNKNIKKHIITYTAENQHPGFMLRNWNLKDNIKNKKTQTIQSVLISLNSAMHYLLQKNLETQNEIVKITPCLSAVNTGIHSTPT